MRARALLGALLVALAPGAGGASEQTVSLNTWVLITFTAPVPCSVACPHWLDSANVDVDGNGENDIAFDPCRNPKGTDDALSPAPGLPYEEGVVFDDLLVGPRPDGAVVLIVEISPLIDWDLFLCSESGSWLSGPGCYLRSSLCGNTCDNQLGPKSPILVGCKDRQVISVVEGRLYRARAYNYSDPLPVQGRYCFSSRGSCQES